MPDTTRDELQREIERCWPLAQAHWSRFLLLHEPIDDSHQPSVAQIHLGTRQIALHFEQILEKGLTGSVEALLAHEIGHHVRYPGTMAVEARMRLLERSILPFEDYSLTNLFTDLMINEQLGQALREQLIAVYRAFTSEAAFHADGRWKRDPAFLFYLAVYEELWRLEPGRLMGPAHAEFARRFPDARGEAQLLAQNLFLLGPNIYTQYLYFLSILCRYLRPLVEQLPEHVGPYRCGRGVPSPDDWAEALGPSAREREAVERALREGWFAPDQAERLDKLSDLEERIAGLPGFGTDDAQRVPEIMAAWYRQQAEVYLFRPPPQRRLGEAVVPTTHEEWEPGDAVREIDWPATLLLRGDVLGAATPLRRERIADHEGYDAPLWQPRIEIYLDVSGSMPDPRLAVNAMTLAAQILATGAIRAGGRVRAALYSSSPVLYWQWCRSEVEVSRFLMHYIGSGTDFPFALLERSVRECGREQPIRVIITDTDFDHNCQEEPQSGSILAEAVAASPHCILLQHRPNARRVARYRSGGLQVVEVHEMRDFPRLAADLTFALFPDGSHDALPT